MGIQKINYLWENNGKGDKRESFNHHSMPETWKEQLPLPTEGQEGEERKKENPRKEEWVIERMRASGPGGQHMQKTESKVRVRWYFEASKYLSTEQKEKLNRAFPKGYIEAVSQETRSQIKNIALAKEKINERVAEVFAIKKERIPDVMPKAAKERRLEEKKKISQKKRLRRSIELE